MRRLQFVSSNRFHQSKQHPAPSTDLWLRITTNTTKSRGWPPVSALYTQSAANPHSAVEDSQVWHNIIPPTNEYTVRIPHDAQLLVSSGEDWHELLLQSFDASLDIYILPITYQEAFILLPFLPTNIHTILADFLSKFALPNVRIGIGTSRLLATLALSKCTDANKYFYIESSCISALIADVLLKDLVCYIPDTFLSSSIEARRGLCGRLGNLTCTDVIALGVEGWQERFRILCGNLSASQISNTDSTKRKSIFGCSVLLADRFYRLARGMDDRQIPDVLSASDYSNNTIETTQNSPITTNKNVEDDVFGLSSVRYVHSERGFLSDIKSTPLNPTNQGGTSKLREDVADLSVRRLRLSQASIVSKTQGFEPQKQEDKAEDDVEEEDVAQMEGVRKRARIQKVVDDIGPVASIFSGVFLYFHHIKQSKSSSILTKTFFLFEFAYR